MAANAPAAVENADRIVRDLASIDVVSIGLVLVAAVLLVKLVEWALPRVAGVLPGRLRIGLLPLVPVLRLLVALLALLLIVPEVIEPTFSNLIALFGAAGIALGFAFKDYASSLIAGVVALSEQPYRQGDWVEIGGRYGEVRAMGMRALTLVTPDDDAVTVPHMKLWTDAVSNANDGARTLMVVTDFYLAPDHDAAAVRRRLEEVALTSCYLDHARPRLVVLVEEPWGTHYRLRAYPFDARDQFLFQSDLTVRGKEALTALGCRFAAAPALPEGGGGR